MRRKDRQINDSQLIEEILETALICRIGMIAGNRPYIVPMNFAYHDQCLYLHSAREGRKIEILKKNQQICFEIEQQTELVKSDDPCKWSMRYLSVIGFGRAFLIDDLLAKKASLDIIMQKYSSRQSFDYPDNALNKVLIIKIEIDEMTGKKAGY